MPPYNPKHHHRRSTRLKGYDYTLPGGYFVTILTSQREMLFGTVVNGEMQLNELGEIVNQEWLRTEEIRPYVSLDTFIIMPNHLHGINNLLDVRATGRSPLLPTEYSPPGPAPKSLGAIIAGFKAAATIRINKHRHTPSQSVWHRNYYDRIIRDDDELHKIRNYIVNNPLAWDDDEHNPIIR